MSFARYMFHVGCDKVTFDDLKTKLKTHCKKWIFQKEQGEETGYIHWQISVSLKRKRAKNVASQTFWNANMQIVKNEEMADFYAMKDETRLDGPWSDKMEPAYLPTHLRFDTWNPFQTAVLAKASSMTTRQMLFVVDSKGNRGKSTLAVTMGAKKLAVHMPPWLTSVNDIMRWAYAELGMMRKRVYCFLDLPRCHTDDQWDKFYAALEAISNGWACDERYNYRKAYFEVPYIVVFCNTMPEGLRQKLSRDRAIVFEVPEIF